MLLRNIKRKRKISVGIIFGGRSGEHEVSLVSAESVMKALDKKKYEVIPIGITKDGVWLATGDPLKALKLKNLKYTKKAEVLIPAKSGFLRVGNKKIRVDVVFPVLHGTYGEDGTIQGLFEMANIPYVGAGVLGSAVGMDKVVQKQLCEQAKLPIVKYIWFLKKEWTDKHGNIVRRIERFLRYPVFIKPANLGSSVGITKAKNRRELIVGVNLALKYDSKILVEQACPNAREIECSVLGNDEPLASLPGEVIPSGEFYDYDAKYVDGKSKTIAPVKLPRKLIQTIRNLACQVFCATDCAGMARVDFLLDNKRQKIYINEINTIPGFTSISMYPKLWQAGGLAYSDLLNSLINLAFQRFEKKEKLLLSYKPKKKWYK